MALKIVLAVVIAYFLGAIPFGYIVSKVQGVDIMSQGSGNIGFTNVWRVMGIKSGIIVLVCDMDERRTGRRHGLQSESVGQAWVGCG